MQSSQLSTVRRSASPVGAVTPERLISGWAPMKTTPATMLAVASSRVSATDSAQAASSLARKTSVRVAPRVRIVFQVPWRSSEAKRSPPTSPAITGSPQLPAKLSRTSERAKPEEWT